MLLSIVMMIKNEEKHLDKTLKALLPLMNDINSELIILDTGSTDNSVEISKKYTDKVYFDKWNDNFADMRNKSISYAKGDWILIIDADEELVKYDKLVEFFDTKLHKKYNCASIDLNSLLSKERNTTSTVSIIRLLKNDENLKYEGAIHEQPTFKAPLYNNIASFNHYGYMFDDEELKNKKLKRNEKILLSEYELTPEDPYISFQLGQNYTASKELEKALYYLEKSYNLYEEKNIIYIPINLSLAKVYVNSKKYEECEKVCSKYIKNDDKNIDIYFYLGLSEYNLKKYKQSLDAYNRYLYLIEHFELSTQYKDVFCREETICYKEAVREQMVDIYYKLNSYEDVIKECKSMNYIQLKKVYNILFKSLNELNRKENIVDIYIDKSKTPSIKKEVIKNIELFINDLKVDDKEKFYLLFSKIQDNYGVLNKARLGNELSHSQVNKVLISEKEDFYADLIYYAIEDGVDIKLILKDVSNYNNQIYLNYLIKNRKNCIPQLYDYLLKQKNTLDIEKLSLYNVIAKTLLLRGNLEGEKYKTLFLMNIMYRYEYLKLLYNVNLNDEDIQKFVSDKDDLFIMNIISLQHTKEIDKVEYIRNLKNILIENPKYTQGIQILINQFENELKENEELTQLKKQYKSIIENNIQTQNLDVAIGMIDEYESMFEGDSEILNMKAIIQIMMQKFEDADIILKNAFILNNNDYNTIFNIAYLKECTNEIDEAIRFYTKIVNNCKEEKTVLEAKEKINSLTKIS